MSDLDPRLAGLAAGWYAALERGRQAYEAMALAAYAAAGSPYAATLAPLPGALLWLQEAATLDGWPCAAWLRVWHRYLGELRRDGVVPREETP